MQLDAVLSDLFVRGQPPTGIASGAWSPRERPLPPPHRILVSSLLARSCSAIAPLRLLAAFYTAKVATPRQIGEQGYIDNAQPINSRMPKPAPAGPTTACQRDDLICAGCNPLESLANVPSQPNGSSVGRPRIKSFGWSMRGLTFTADLGCAARATGA